MSSLLDPTVDEYTHGVACHFSTLRNPTVLDRLKLGAGKANSSLSVQINTGTINVSSAQRPTTQFAACDVHIRLHGKKDVYLLLGNGVAVPYAFESRLFAVEFMGAVHLVQHIEALKTATPLPSAAFDAMLKEQMKCTMEFAREMWSLAMWSQLYPYSGLVEGLGQAVDLLQRNQLLQLADLLHAVYLQFHSLTAINKVADANHPVYYRASHMTLLVAKVKALQLHTALYLEKS
ncbi:hypothetical protein H257_18673 [Aphanomyces astaci]|uniref:Uncharacterized protein n=1 Tax=Aphanomyces astaci TaxID=112090 RepID=W4FCI4_APHAT|nr:hypothetical protein H257_18673 [Aphanomyces astaci]ETV64438.1 hypothetical protein H257_18673 [Aphanomyces astaci]RQM10020.1 hypothetical protein B5M09_009812 [Aphanomyces astaci]|eukprot:XP_009846069.1 hypothetical protein H257_18673 [Aphanomyces astaci]